ncbi:MAG: DUF4249 family protein, partial [Flavisolibacter sp.]|nr:DUF4249 family protein [Flavisolibacter sp.]
STTRLSDDVVYLMPLVSIPNRSDKLGVRYSILVKQYALDKQTYEFYQQMKKNTESIGSIFDPQPTVLTTNIHSVSNPDEKVIGYVTVATMQEKRIFIAASELSNWGYRLVCSCEDITVPNIRDSLQYYFAGDNYIAYNYDMNTNRYSAAT